MEVFDPAGHLSDSALLALVRNEDALDALARLEMAEHLSYCDRCLQRYTQLLAQDALLTPGHSCRESLWRRIRARTMGILTSRCARGKERVISSFCGEAFVRYKEPSFPGRTAPLVPVTV